MSYNNLHALCHLFQFDIQNYVNAVKHYKVGADDKEVPIGLLMELQTTKYWVLYLQKKLNQRDCNFNNYDAGEVTFDTYNQFIDDAFVTKIINPADLEANYVATAGVLTDREKLNLFLKKKLDFSSIPDLKDDSK